MLDIRATHYPSPLAEVPFSDVVLTVHLLNVADETGLVTGKFRVYNDNTGSLIHTSEIAPVTMTAGQVIDVDALTDFDPPAPLDDVYFVLFDGNASNPLVPNGIGIHLGAFHFDVKPVGMGPAPATHHLTHEEGGSDEIEVADMATAELDDTLVLQPDGAGGVEWEAIPAGVNDHDLLNKLAYANAGHTGFAPTAHDHDGDNLKFTKQHPNTDSSTSFQILKADNATAILTVNSTLGTVGIGTAPTQFNSLSLAARVKASGFELTDGLCYIDSNILAIYGSQSSNVCLSLVTDETGSTWGNLDVKRSLGINVSPPVLSDGNGIHIAGKLLRIATPKTPANSGATGNKGEICWDADYIYVCIAANTWVRVETQTW